ncbi:NAD(P)/FAD-dependent oxidoreductase [Sporosarcina koreensis]|uniref:NAD(P)/FAD-dependent oxidoreductase n=1 Tax=Sporosarcina koreensis TaxID=334735 RepID=UPI00058CC4DF|nr:FAD-dependent oxidoreductase [Sporosarcina koreensis]
MKLTTGQTYWDRTQNGEEAFPALQQDLETEVLVIGAGMSGTLAASVLARAGKQVAVMDSGRAGMGSSSANTGLLQYSSDTMLSEFVDSIGERDAVLFYRMCLEAMDELTELAGELPDAVEYRLRDSIYYASREEDAEKLKREYSYLKKYEFPADFLSRQALLAEYGIDKPAALHTWHDAEVNPYRFIRALTDFNAAAGVQYYENTPVDVNSRTGSCVRTESGHTIRYKSLVIATGYTDLYPEIRDKAQINQTFAIATEPLAGPLWPDQVMVWETKKPYLYFRTTADRRIIAGGLDEESDRLHEDQELIRRKGQEILDEVASMFSLADVKIADAWNSLFGVSKDGLPFLGRSAKEENTYFLLGYEGNGTCYSMAGARIICDQIDGITNEYAPIVAPGR